VKSVFIVKKSKGEFSNQGHRKLHFGAFDVTHVKQITCSKHKNVLLPIGSIQYQTNEVNPLKKKPQEKLNSSKKATTGSTHLLQTTAIQPYWKMKAKTNSRPPILGVSQYP
jgi:hypothetical protein